jgi:hypothetical protein
MAKPESNLEDREAKVGDGKSNSGAILNTRRFMLGSKELWFSPRWRLIILAVCALALLVHFTVTVGRVGRKSGDYDVNREFGRRFLQHEHLYEGGLCFNYMPASALYWAPLALVPPRVGMGLRYLTALICLALILRWLRLMTFPQGAAPANNRMITSISLVLAIHYLIRDFDDGGPHVILLAFLMGGIYCIWRGREKLGALWLGLAIAVKITPGLFLPFFLWKRQWRVFGYTSAVTFLWITLPALWMGPMSWWEHQRQWNEIALSVAGNSSNEFRKDNEERVQNQALKPAITRFLVIYPPGHPLRLKQAGYVDFLNLSPSVAGRVVIVAMLGLWGILCWQSRRAWNNTDPRMILAETSALLCLVLLFSPVTWLQHFVFGLPAIYWIVAREQSCPRAITRWSLTAYVALALLMNRELLGRENYLLLLSYHTHTICLLLLFSLIIFGLWFRRAGQIHIESPSEIQSIDNKAA